MTWLQDVVFTSGTSITQGVITVTTTLTVSGDAVFTGGLDASGATSAIFYDSTLSIKDNTTPTKIMKFQLSGLSAGTSTITVPDGNDTMATIAGTQTLTNKTITAPVLSGSATGTYTLAGTPTITAPTISTPTISDPILTSQKYSTLITYTSDTTLANITGLTGFTLTAGATYVFEMDIKSTCTTTGGLSMAFKYTTATVSALNVSVTQCAAASIVTSLYTVTTDQAKFIDNKTAAFLVNRITGTLVVGTGGTVAVQAAQNTSAGGGDVTSILAGSWCRFTRVS